MSIPLFSIIGIAKRNWFYRDCYDSIARDVKVPFEVIFVGPNPPTESMPNNFKYIVSDVKPAQCLEIAARNAIGEYLIVVGDDVRFSDNFLNRLYDYTLRLNMDKTLVSFRYALNDIVRDFQLVLNVSNVDAPICGQSPVFLRSIWNSLGGIDQRFVCSMGDIDMQMRFYEYGMNPFITPDCFMNEVVTQTEINVGTLYRKSGRSDTNTLNSMWMVNGKFLKKRTSNTIPFNDANILTNSQGELSSSGKMGSFVWN